MTGQSNLHLDAKLMASVHPYASSGTPIHSGGATVAKKEPLAKGIPIPVPTNQRRLSNFSVKTANRALMTGYRDGGGSSSRRKSSSFSQGFQPPPFYPHKDDFDVIGTVPGFEKLVEAEAQKHDKGKAKAVPNVTTLFDVDVQKEPKQNKRKKTGKERMEDDNPPSKLASSGPRGRRRSSVSLGSSGTEASTMCTSPPAPSPPSLLASTMTVTIPTTGLTAPNRLKNINGFRTGASIVSKSTKPATTAWPQMPVSCVRVLPSAEFTAGGMTVQFGVERLSLTIRRNSTKIPHSEIKAVNYYTASTLKIFQFATFSKLAESSALAQHYDPAGLSDKAPMITLFIDTSSSCIVSICAILKQKGVETRRLTPSAAEEILAKKKRSPAPESIDSSEETLFIYPFNSSIKSKSIAVRAEDASRLNDGEFLNDTLIEFGLKYVQANAEVRNAALAGQVYIFNTFFYQRLVAKPSKGQANSYEAIKNWTAKIDLFSMKYIIVPINENLHWHLAIITNPGLLLRRANESESDVSLELVDGSGIDEGKSPPANSIVIGSDNEPTKNPKMPFINGSEKPYILCLNSLGGTHSAVFSVLRSYLQQVLLSRKGISMTLTSKEIAGKFSSKCPKQDNLSDCGVYLLHYAEVFLRNPETILDAIVNRTDDKDLWSVSELATKRTKYKDIVVALTEQYRVYKFHRNLVEDIKGKSNDALPDGITATSMTTAMITDAHDNDNNTKELLSSTDATALDKGNIISEKQVTHDLTMNALKSMDPES